MPEAINTMPATNGADNDTAALLAVIQEAPEPFRRVVKRAAELTRKPNFGLGDFDMAEAFRMANISANRRGEDPEAWRAVEGASGPASAAWRTLNALDEALWVAPGLVEILGQKDDLSPDALQALAWHLSDHVRAMVKAINDAMDVLRPASLAEREAADAERERQRAQAAPVNSLRVARVLEAQARELRAKAQPKKTAKRRPATKLNGKAAPA